MNEFQMTIVSEDGTEELVDILFTHEHDGKSYVVFQFAESEELGAAIYTADLEDEENGTLDFNISDEELEMLEEELQKYYEYLDEEEEL